jgi:hypothetical protein
MKLKFKNLLSIMLITSISKIAGGQTVNNSQNAESNAKDNDDGNALVQKKQKLLQKYIIKFGANNSYLIAGHRSHRSHQSHRSSTGSSYHYTPPKSTTPAKRSSHTVTPSSKSNSSSYGSTTETPLKAAESTHNTNVINTAKPAENQNSTTTDTPHIYNLGDRSISLNTYGTDVKVLATLLAKHGYLADADIEQDTQGYVVCNKAMVSAIKKFQKDANLEADGYAGTETIKALKEWKTNNE